FLFLTQSIDFADAPNRPDDYPPLYVRHNKEKIASDILADKAKKKRAQAIVEDLYEETPAGNVYDEQRIDFLCTIFGIRADEYAEKTLGIMEYAEQFPDIVVKAFDDHMNKVKSDVLYALQVNA